MTRLIVRRLDFFRPGFGFHLCQSSPDGRLAVAEPVVMKVHDPDTVLPDEALFHLTAEEATQAMDALWEAGIRPTMQGGTGELSATKAHLEDMRTLVFKKP